MDLQTGYNFIQEIMEIILSEEIADDRNIVVIDPMLKFYANVFCEKVVTNVFFTFELRVINFFLNFVFVHYCHFFRIKIYVICLTNMQFL